MRKKKIVEFEPCGNDAMRIRFVLKGGKGAVQFLMCSGWYPQVFNIHARPYALDLGYHSPRPRYIGQKPIAESCEYLDGKRCYYDGSSLAADRILERLLKEGSDAVWEELEEYYKEIFVKRR